MGVKRGQPGIRLRNGRRCWVKAGEDRLGVGGVAQESCDDPSLVGLVWCWMS